MISPKLTNCKECANIPDLLRRIDCKIAELGNNLYNNVVFMLNRPIATSEISQLLVYKRVLRNRFCDTHYAKGCPDVSTEDIASKVIRLTAGCVPHCGEPTVCEITTCPITPVPNPTTTSTSTSSTSTTSTTSTSSTSTTTTTLNCNFSGVIVCNPSTTTTTTLAPTTTTSTTYFPDPFGVPCLWSTNGGDPGLLAVYDFDTNTATDVLVPNDFNDAPALNRPLCATEDKLWLVSAVDQGSNPDNDFDDQVYIREWDIDATGVAPTLTYVREITLESGQFPGSFNAGSSVWAITAIDNNTLIVGVGNDHTAPVGTGGSGQRYAYEFSISTPGDITITDNDLLGSKLLGATSNDYYGKLSNLTYTNSGQLIVGWYNILRVAPFDVTNYIGVFNGTPSDPDFGLNNQAIPTINLQEDVNFPEFEPAYTGPWDIPFWGVNGLAQILNPENGVVYTIDQSPLYELTFTTLVSSDDDWLSSATHCSNITFNIADTPECIENSTYLPPFFFDSEGNPAVIQNGGVYDPTPQQFQFAGMTCTASISENVNAFDDVRQSTDQDLLGCSGLVEPASSVPFTRAVSGYNFNITIEFPQAMNDLSIRAAILNSNSDLTSGDVYYVETNGGTPTLSITQGCYVQVNGNRLFGGVPNPPVDTAYNNEGDGEFLVTAPNNFTSMTISGNAPTGGPLFLGCAEPPADCRLIYTVLDSCTSSVNTGRCYSGQAAFARIYSWDVNTNTQQETLLPPGTAVNSPNFAVSENYIILDVDQTVTGVKSIARYGYTDISGIPSDTTFDGQFIDYPNDNVRFFGSVMEAVTDTKFLGLWQQAAASDGSKIIEWDLSGTTLSYNVKIEVLQQHGYYLTGDLLLTYKEDGTPNKIIGLGFIPPLVSNGQQGFLLQFDYETNVLEGVLDLPAGVRGGASLGIYDGGIYIAPDNNSVSQPDLTGVWRLDIETQQWTKLPDEDVPSTFPFPSGSSADFSATPQCRISNGLVFGGTTTTTTTDPNITTTTTTTVPSGVRTIFTHFQGIVNN